MKKLFFIILNKKLAKILGNLRKYLRNFHRYFEKAIGEFWRNSRKICITIKTEKLLKNISKIFEKNSIKILMILMRKKCWVIFERFWKKIYKKFLVIR